MISHAIRFTLKPNAPKDQVDVASEQLRKRGREIKVVQSFCRPLDINSQTDKIKKFSDVTIKESVKYWKIFASIYCIGL
jgi:hypothetical protein